MSYNIYNQDAELAALEEKDDAIKLPASSNAVKPLHKVISEHKDVVKIVIQLNSIISTFKGDVQVCISVYILVI